MLLRPHSYRVYIIKCNDGTLYTGITNNLERRLRQHNGQLRGGAKYTRGRGPVELVYVEKFPTRAEAAKREWYIKHELDQRGKMDLINKTTPTKVVIGQ